ncbi:SpoIIE family protein phosphatase [Desulfuribacillus alkaliarsenatis]|uniref:HAMP domain-containing protein n=1 Tax=Desulfuribacillus alkaliarsenatis TaxID=766136 RepID=A0A1E5FZ02_9FIRM|nr:SpoIIE family protein phosphatase [Desulfuribacillus alkaliarsenatis]OEF95814.1 hypothetical protein BHF68_10455 [Desulfuribacillus alkaliarsenatis]
MEFGLRAKVIIAIVVLIMFCSLIFTVRLNIQSQALLDERQQLLTHISLDPVERRISVIHSKLELVAIQIEHNNEIISAFVERDREQLARAVDPIMEQLVMNNINVLHFHLPDATTFYRGHNPALYGDNLYFRNMVLEITENKESISGFEFGISGLNYRVVKPIFIDGEYIGSFEVGETIGNHVLDVWKRAGAGEWYLYEFNNGEFGELLASTCGPLLTELCSDNIKMLTLGETTECTDGKEIINIVPLNNYQGEINWVVVRVYNNTEMIQLQHQQTRYNVIFGIALASMFGIISFIFLHRLFSPFHELINTTDQWATGQLQIPLKIVNSGDELERLSKTMENMRVSLDIQTKELQVRNQELTIVNKKLSELYKLRNDEVAKAAELHKKFLPSKLPTIEGAEVAAYYMPSGLVGGDFYNAIKYDDKLITYIVDVSGHGLDGAMMNVFISNVINQYIETISSQQESFMPSELLDYLVSKYLKEEFPADYHFAIVIMLYDSKQQTITYVNAGNHITPFFGKKGRIERLKEAGLPISTSIPKELMVYEDTVFTIDVDDWVLLVSSDGLPEQEYKGELYGEERIARLIENRYKPNAKELLNTIAMDLREYTRKSTYTDDVTIIALSSTKNNRF